MNDGSQDKTLSELRKTNAIILNHKINYGKGAALRTGFRYAIKNNYDYLILMDGDGQHDPKEIPKFLKEIKNKYDLIIGCRRKRGSKMPNTRRFVNFSTSFLISVKARQWIKDTQSGFRAIKVKTLKNLKLKRKKYDLESELIIKMAQRKARIKCIPIKTIYSDEESAIHPFKDTLRFFRVLFSKN